METFKKINLFWDIDQDKLDSDKHKTFIVRRILEKGDVDDIRWAIGLYGWKSIASIFQENSDKLDAKSNNFWRLYFNLNKSQCIRKQSMKKQSPFWQR